MIRKYFKNVFITFGIIALAWTNVSFAYRTKREVSQLTETVNSLSSALEEAEQNKISTEKALNDAEDKIKELISQKSKEEAEKKILLKIAPVIPVKTAVQKPAPKPVVNTVVKTVKPSRVSRAS